MNCLTSLVVSIHPSEMVGHVEKSCKDMASNELFASSIETVINLLKLVSIERALQKVNRYYNTSWDFPAHSYMYFFSKGRKPG